MQRTVELDEVIRALDPATRRAFQTWQQSLASAVNGRGRDLNDALGNLPAFADDGTALLRVLDVQHAAVRGLINGTSQVFGALDMAKAQTPMDAMTAMLGGERIQNLDPVYGTHFPTATTTRPSVRRVAEWKARGIGADELSN